MKKVATESIVFFLADLDGGGAERAIVSLAENIAKCGYNVILVVGDANSDYRAEVSADVKLIDFKTRSPLKILLNLVGFLRSHKPYVIMSALDLANIMLVMASKLSCYKGKLILSQRAVIDASLRDLGKIRRTVTKQLLKFSFKQANGIVSNSKAAANEIESQFGVSKAKLFTIQNAINLELIRELSKAPINTVKFEKETPLILSIGSLTPRKDMKTLIKAFAKIIAKRDAKLVIIGKGPEEKALKQLIIDLDLQNRVNMLGFHRNPYNWLASANVFVSASLEEGFPNVIAEALALGRQVVATDCPGDTADLLEQGKWGRIVEMKDVDGMAEAIAAAIDFPLPADGIERAAQFTPLTVTKAYLNVLLNNTALKPEPVKMGS